MRAQQPEWLRGPANLDGQHIVLPLHRAQPYPLVGDWDLLFDLAAVRRPADAVAFVRDHGLLRHGPGGAVLREPFSDWLETAYTLTNLLDLYNLVLGASAGDVASVETLWETWVVRLRPLLDPMPTTDGELLFGASHALAALVNQGLHEARVQVASGVDWPVDGAARERNQVAFTLAPRTPDLLGLAYLSLAMLVTLKTPLRTCKGCRRRFVPRSPGQRYHDRACANQARVRNRQRNVPHEMTPQPEMIDKAPENEPVMRDPEPHGKQKKPRDLPQPAKPAEQPKVPTPRSRRRDTALEAAVFAATVLPGLEQPTNLSSNKPAGRADGARILRDALPKASAEGKSLLGRLKSSSSRSKRSQP